MNKIKPNSYGATPLTFAIDSVATDLETKQLLPARILVITDGKPNCTDQGYVTKHVCRLFDSFESGRIDVKVDIIGYKAKDQDKEFIACANKHPGILTYLGSPNNLQDLGRTINTSLPTAPISPPQNDFLNPSVLAAIIGAIGAIVAAYINKGLLFSLMRPKDNITIKVSDVDTDKNIKGAKVSLTTPLSSAPIFGYTNSEGICSFKVKDRSETVTIYVEKDKCSPYETSFISSNESVIKEIKLKENPLLFGN